MVAQGQTAFEQPEAGDSTGKTGQERPNFNVDELSLSDFRDAGPDSGEEALKGVVTEVQLVGDLNGEGSDRAPEKVSEAAENKDGEFSRAVENEDGSRVEFSKLPGGQEVVSTVVHPSGERSEYSDFDEDGKPKSVKEFDAEGNMIGNSTREGDNIWTMAHKDINGGQPFKNAGDLTVGEDGTHEFKEALSGNVFRREAGGKTTYKDGSTTHELKPQEAKEREAADTSKSINDKGQDVSDNAEEGDKADDNPSEASEVVRAVEQADGSRVEFIKTADGKEVVSKVVHPSGEASVYSGHDKDGNPSRVEEYDAAGNKVGTSTREGNVWTTSHKAINNGIAFKQVGELTVDGEGNHKFKDALTGSEFERKSDGSMSNKDGATGRVQELKKADDKVRSPEKEIGEGSDKRRSRNADGSELEYTTLDNGKEVVTEIINPSGQTSKIEYDSEGNLSKVDEFAPEGSLLSSTSKVDGKWTVEGKGQDGNPVKVDLPGSLEITAEGVQVFTHGETGMQQLKKPDGSMFRVEPGKDPVMTRRPERPKRR